MNDLRKAAEALMNHWDAGEYKNCTGYMAGYIRALRQALAQPDEVLAEREACAEVCDDWPNGRDDVYSIGQAIRDRRDNLQTAIEKGTKAWADVPDATEWVEELRGNDTPEVTGEVTTEVSADNVEMSEERVPKMDKSIPEPEGWVKIDEVRQYFDSVGCGTIYKTAGEDRVPLYAAPPKREWVGLTDDEIAKYWGDAFAGNTQYVQKFARIIEAKIKEKNVPQP